MVIGTPLNLDIRAYVGKGCNSEDTHIATYVQHGMHVPIVIVRERGGEVGGV